MSGTIPFLPPIAQGAPGLLGAVDLASLRPPPAYRAPRDMMSVGQLVLSDRSAMVAALPDLFADSPLPDELEPYRAGLQPSIAPAGVAWQQEVIFDRLFFFKQKTAYEMMQ